MEKYVDERALRHFRDKAVEVDIQPKIKDLQTNLGKVDTDLKNRMDGYVEQLCRVETKGASLTSTPTTVGLSVDELYSARLVVWFNGQTSGAANQSFSISASSSTDAVGTLVQVSMGSGNEAVSGSIALDIMPGASSRDRRSFIVVASGCVRVGDDVTLVQGVKAITFPNANSKVALAIKITPTSAIGSAAGCGYSYSALYDAESLVGA